MTFKKVSCEPLHLHAHHENNNGEDGGGGGRHRRMAVTFGQFSADFLRQSFSTNRNKSG